MQEPATYRPGKPASVRQGCESARSWAQLCRGSQPGRTAGSGDRHGPGFERAEGDSDARNRRAVRSPLSELRSASVRSRGADHGEHRARYLAAAGGEAQRRPAQTARGAGLRESGPVRGLLRGAGMFRVTRRYESAARHRRHSGQLGEEENSRLYGKCNNPYGHGHNYVVEVSARGPADARTGQAVDVAALDELVRQHVVSRFDHRNLNLEAEAFAH